MFIPMFAQAQDENHKQSKGLVPMSFHLARTTRPIRFDMPVIIPWPSRIKNKAIGYLHTWSKKKWAGLLRMGRKSSKCRE